MPQTTGYEYEVGEPSSVLDVIQGKESVKVDHRVVIPMETILLVAGMTILTTLIYKVLS